MVYVSRCFQVDLPMIGCLSPSVHPYNRRDLGNLSPMKLGVCLLVLQKLL